MAQNFEEGDVIRMKHDCAGSLAGRMYRLKDGYENGHNRGALIAREGIDTADIEGNMGCACSNEWELVENKSINKIMNIKESFVLALTSEPNRTFRKAGITNGDNILTDEGQKIFLSWLLSKHADEFKVLVDEMVKEK